MANIHAVLKQLQGQRNDLERQIKQLDSALSALGSLDGAGRGRGRGGPRRMSAAARARIAAAQKKRWAAWKAARKKK
jgi:hypothetical protein